MFDGQFVFSQLMDFLPRREFNACVERYRGNRRRRGFSCRDQFLCLAFAQLTYRESLRDIETCLRALEPKLYHAGFRGKVSRSTLADANRAHDWRIYADFAQVLIRRARKLYASEPLAVELEANGLRPRLDDHRLVSELVSVGQVSPSQGSGQAAHADRSARQHSLFYPHFPRENARCERARPIADRAGRVLRDGSRLRRFPATVSLHARRRRSSSLAANGTSTARAARVARSTRRPDCAAIRRLSWRASSRRGCIPIRCAASRSTTPSTSDGWCS